MSTPGATPKNETASHGFIVAGPRKSDPIAGALRAAFGRQDAAADEFAALLRRIDLADREAGSC